MQLIRILLAVLLFPTKSTVSLIHIDLTHSIKSTNPAFPGLVPFNFTEVYQSWKQDDTHERYFKALNTFITSEHFGTHIDAPYHGSNTSWTIERIPLERLVSIQALIIDVSKKDFTRENDSISIEDLNEKAMKEAQGFYVLLFYTGRSIFWPNQRMYAGGYTKLDLDFPGVSARLASYLVTHYSEKLVGVGIDTLSIDAGSVRHFNTHRILFKNNIYVLENVAALDLVLKYLSNRRETFFSLDVLPMKIEGGTGAPCRLIAHLEDFNHKDTTGWFLFLLSCFLLLLFGIAAKLIYNFRFAFA